MQLTIQTFTVRCLDEELTNQESPHSRIVRDISIPPNQKLRSGVKQFIHNLIDHIISKAANSKFGHIAGHLVTNITGVVPKINEFLGGDILVLRKNVLTLNENNLVPILKSRAIRFLEDDLKLKSLILFFAKTWVFKVLDDAYLFAAPFIKEIKIVLPSTTKKSLLSRKAPSTLQKSPNTLIRDILVDVAIHLIEPYRAKLNQTLSNITNELLVVYKPVLPNNLVLSIVSCGMNQVVLRAFDVVETIREMLNDLFTPQSRSRRSVDIITDNNNNKLLQLALHPVRLLIQLVFTPIHHLLKITSKYFFISIGPTVGSVVLKPFEAIVLNFISLIPCLGC